MIFAKQFCTLVCASECRAVLAYVYLANMWCPFRIAAYIYSVDQAGKHLTGHPLVVFDCRRGLARWYFEYVRVHMRLSLPIFSLMFGPSGIEIFSLMACFNEI